MTEQMPPDPFADEPTPEPSLIPPIFYQRILNAYATLDQILADDGLPPDSPERGFFESAARHMTRYAAAQSPPTKDPNP